LAMVELAGHYGSAEPVRIRRIADTHGIPARFLGQSLLQLKSAGFVNSTRGASGGYPLARPPDEITLGDIVGVIDSHANEPLGGAAEDSPFAQLLSQIWQEIAA